MDIAGSAVVLGELSADETAYLAPGAVVRSLDRGVRIGAGSWLGHGTIVLPGASIGRHVVVGAGSVVTGELPDFSVAVGNPARVVREAARPGQGRDEGVVEDAAGEG